MKRKHKRANKYNRPYYLGRKEFKKWFEKQLRKEGDCLLWTMAIGSSGHGRVGFGDGVWAAHRLAWWMATKKKPKSNMLIMHTCPNKHCCQVEHMYIAWKHIQR